MFKAILISKSHSEDAATGHEIWMYKVLYFPSLKRKQRGQGSECLSHRPWSEATCRGLWDLTSFIFTASPLSPFPGASGKPYPEAWLFSWIPVESLSPSLAWCFRIGHSHLTRQSRLWEVSSINFPGVVHLLLHTWLLYTGQQGFPWPESHIPTFFLLHVAFTLFQVDTRDFSSRKPLYSIFPAGWFSGLSKQHFLLSCLLHCHTFLKVDSCPVCGSSYSLFWLLLGVPLMNWLCFPFHWFLWWNFNF